MSARKASRLAELRQDPATRRWIVTGRRPVTADARDSDTRCPFCPGNEDLTPKAVREHLEPNGAWGVRAFNDRAPIFRIEGALNPRGEGLFDRMNTLGAHEIVVETPQHGVTLAELPATQIAKAIEVCRDRILDLKQDRRFRYVSIFKDQRSPGPTVIGHAHSQILATPVLPYFAETEFRVCQPHFRKKERCLYCDVIQQEINEEKRIVDQNADFVALCPFASRSPYELWLLPLRHFSSFEKDLSEPARVASFASFFKTTLQRVEKISPSLHLIVHTEPNLDGHVPSKDYWGTIPDDFHWHVEMSPDIEEQRGYLGREGLYFNPIPAEEATLVLRALEPGTDPATD